VANIIDILREAARQQRTGDDQYFRTMPWIFRLVVDGVNVPVGPVGPDGIALFPLPIGPEEFNYELPFATTVTPTEEGGRVVERGGIITANIFMAGGTGFKLRRNKVISFAGADGDFTSLLAENGNPFIAEDISGQLSFWLLANRCFEGYSKLTQDPQWGPKTRLELHIMKERIHVEVEPKVFGLRRSAGRERVSYRYEIQLEVVGPAREYIYIVEDDKSIFDWIAEGRAMMREAIQAARATLQDLNAARAELTQLASGVASIIDDMTSVIDAASDFVEGVKDTFDMPKQFITSISDSIDSMADFFEEVATVPADVSASFREMGDQLDAILAGSTGRYQDPWKTVSDTYNELTEPTKTSDELADEDQALIQSTYDTAVDANGTMSIDAVFDAPVRPGDLQRQNLTKLGGRMDRYAYDGVQEITIGQGDTMQALAARYLDDAAKWPDIAAANQLEAPYITTGPKLPNTLSEGSTILIPVSRRVPQNAVISPMADVDRQLGEDAKSVQLDNGQWGWVVDTAHGATDIVKISGLANMAQGLGARLRTIRGENILQQTLGVRRSVGQKQFQDSMAEAVMVTRQQVLADPRVQRLLSMEFEAELDALDIVMRVQPIGYATARVVTVPLT
jgi:hypothetical protein